MRKIYITCIVLIFLYASAHMLYTFFYEVLRSPESKMWFCSAGLCMLFNGLINLFYLTSRTCTGRNITIFANLLLLLFLILLSVIVPEVQVYVFVLVLLETTVCSAFLHRSG